MSRKQKFSKEIDVFPFFSFTQLKSWQKVKQLVGARIIIVSGHCETCHKRVENIVTVIGKSDARTDFEWFFHSLKTDCDKPLRKVVIVKEKNSGREEV